MSLAPAPRAAVAVSLDASVAPETLLLGLADWLAPGVARRVDRRPGRRPRVLGGRRVYASLSGTPGAIVAGVGDRPVGVDVERFRTMRDPQAVGGCLGGIASPWDEACPHRDTVARWTRYEAVVKALGVGTVIPPGRVGVRRGGGVRLDEYHLPLRVRSWRVEDPDASNGFAVSVAARAGTRVLRPKISWRDLPPRPTDGGRFVDHLDLSASLTEEREVSR